jgi:tetratricopeptide (TPR) repeat protein
MYIEFSMLCEIEGKKEALDYATHATNLFVGLSDKFISDYADALEHLAGVERGARCFGSAKSNQLRVVEIRSRLHDELNLPVALCNLGTILMENADFPGATNAYSNAMVRYEKLDRRYPLHELFCLRQWALFLLRQGKCEDATNQFGNILVRCRSAEPEIDLKSDVNNLRIDSYIALAQASVVMGTLEDAEKYQVKAVETFKITLKNANDQKTANKTLSFIRAPNDSRETEGENEMRQREWEEGREQFNQNLGSLHCAHCLQMALDALEKPLAKSKMPSELGQNLVDHVVHSLLPSWATNSVASPRRADLIDALKHNPVFVLSGSLTGQRAATHPVIQCPKHHLEIFSNHSVRRMD